MNINFSTATRGKLHAPHTVSRRELIPSILLKRWATFPEALQEEASLSNLYVRGTLMSPQECEIARCSPNHLEMTTNFLALASDQCPVPHHTGQLAWLPLGNSRDSLRHTFQVYRNSNCSTGTRGNLHAPNIVSRRELIPRILLKR